LIRTAERQSTLAASEGDALQILLGRTYAQVGKPPLKVWSTLYPVWRRGSLAVKSCLDDELKALAKKIPSDTVGRTQVVGFVAPRRPVRRPRRSPFWVGPAPTPEPPVGWRKILPRSAWRPTLSPRRSNLKPMGKPYRITVHHSAHDDVVESRSKAAAAELIRTIQRYHVRNRGWGDIGYHYVIDGSGTIWEARSLRWQGAHAGGANNQRNIGIVLLGNFELTRPAPAQVASLQWLVQHLRVKYGISIHNLYGHCHLKATACPGRYLRAVLRQMNPSLRS
jgi:hypothetical protein